MKDSKALNILMSKQKGVTTIEYAMMAAGIAMVITAVVSSGDGSFTDVLNNMFDNVKDTIKNTEAS